MSPVLVIFRLSPTFVDQQWATFKTRKIYPSPRKNKIRSNYPRFLATHYSQFVSVARRRFYPLLKRHNQSQRDGNQRSRATGDFSMPVIAASVASGHWLRDRDHGAAGF
jgi:hypothetical protein